MTGLIEPTVTAKAKREALRRELETGRRIPAYEMGAIAGLQYNRAVHELRWNVRGCVRPDCPEGVEYGLNILNDNPDPRHPDHTVFFLVDGHWIKPVRIKSKPQVRARTEPRNAIDRDDEREMRRVNHGLPVSTPSLFGDLAPDRSYVE